MKASVRSRLERLTIRRRLAIGLVVLVAVVLAAVGFATVRALQVFLLDQVDQQLEQTSARLVGPRRGPGDLSGQPLGTLAVLIGPTGAVEPRWWPCRGRDPPAAAERRGQAGARLGVAAGFERTAVGGPVRPARQLPGGRGRAAQRRDPGHGPAVGVGAQDGRPAAAGRGRGVRGRPGGGGRPRGLARPPRPAPAEQDHGDGPPGRGTAAGPGAGGAARPRPGRGAEHRGGSGQRGAERDARARRRRLRRPGGLRAAVAAFRRGRQPRVAHAAGQHPRLRRAVPPRSDRRPGRPCAGDAPGRRRGGPDE